MRTRNFRLIVGVAIFIVGVHLFLVSRMIFFPYPELFIYSYLTTKGLLPYAQILDQHFPGLMFFPINLATLGVSTPQAARLVHLGFIFLTQVILFFVAKKILKDNRWALFSNFLYFLWQPFFEGYVLWIETFVTPLLLLAFYFLLYWQDEKKSKDLFFVGLFLGMSLLFKQVVLPLLILTVLYVGKESKSVKRIMPLTLAVGMLLLFLLFYIFQLGVWRDFLYWTVTFNLTTFSEMARKYPDMGSIIKLIPLLGGALFSSFYLLYRKKDKYLVALIIFLVGSLAFVYARFDFIHLQPAIPYAVLIVVMGLRKSGLKKITAVFLLITLFYLIPFYRSSFGEKVLFFGEYEFRVSEKVRELSDPGDCVFAMAVFPHLYQMTDTLPPGRIFVFQFPWFMKEAEERVLSGIISDPPKVIIRDKDATIQGQSIISYMPKIADYIEKNYQVTEIILGTEIMIER